MIVRIDKSFEKDVKKIKDRALLQKLSSLIEDIEKQEDLRKIKSLKKLQRADNFYRIRLDDYRIGVFIEGDTIDLIRFLNRKDIYKYFP